MVQQGRNARLGQSCTAKVGERNRTLEGEICMCERASGWEGHGQAWVMCGAEWWYRGMNCARSGKDRTFELGGGNHA